MKVAATNANVLITGESGTGQGAGGQLHSRAQRARAAPFIKVNCSAIPENLVESELFGHERGAFTGAVACETGLFEVAHRGTIFLDEIADLAASAQAKILRVLQSGEIQKVGSERHHGGRAHALRNAQGSEEGGGRGASFAKISSTGSTSCRSACRRCANARRYSAARPVPDAAAGRAQQHARESPSTMRCSRNSSVIDWPGNVRELQNVLER